VDGTIAPYGVMTAEVSSLALANVTLDMDTTRAVGGNAVGVLGCTTAAGQVTLIQGWDWDAGSDPGRVGRRGASATPWGSAWPAVSRPAASKARA
jgi:hypothetical protein